MKTVTYRIPNISCNHCLHTINTELSALQGVNKVEGNVSSKEVTVTFDSPASEGKLVETLQEINYPPESNP